MVGQTDSYRVQENGEEELSSSDAPVQLLGATWVFVVEDGVGEQTTRLPGQHLQHSSRGLIRSPVLMVGFREEVQQTLSQITKS